MFLDDFLLCDFVYGKFTVALFAFSENSCSFQRALNCR